MSIFFFSPPAHLCTVTYMTIIPLIVTLNNQFNSTQPSVCFLGADGENKMAALTSDWLRHLDFLSETAEWNSTKLNQRQDLNVLD